MVDVDVSGVRCSHSLAIGNADGDAVVSCVLVIARAVSAKAMVCVSTI